MCAEAVGYTFLSFHLESTHVSNLCLQSQFLSNLAYKGNFFSRKAKYASYKANVSYG